MSSSDRALNRSPTASILPGVVVQHIEEVASLRETRSTLLRAPNVELLHLARHDERVYAHLDGLRVAGETGYRLAQVALDGAGVGEMFLAAVAAIERRDREHIDLLLSLIGVARNAERALESAFGWVSASMLRGTTVPLLASDNPLRRRLGIAACSLHRVDPANALAHALEHSEVRLRARALRAAGELGRLDQLASCLAHLVDLEPACRFQAAWSTTLLGDASAAAATLESFALRPDVHEAEALRILLLSADARRARALVRQVVAAGGTPRKVIQATGWAGDVQAVPWLIAQMADDCFARVAGEAFTMLTGAELVRLQLERMPPEKFGGGPTENAEDEDVALDEDDGLPWPDVARVQAWWEANGARLPAGRRCFMGAGAEETHCQQVLRTGNQRQRAIAALLLVLIKPGNVLFNIAAPAPRQQRLLGLPVRVA